MATVNTSCCITDCKRKPSTTCLGCPNLIYCNTHYKQHRDNLTADLQVLTDKSNQFREEIEIQKENAQTHPLIKSIDEWEKRSIDKIRQVAQETREELLRNVNNFIPRVSAQFENLRINLHQDPDDCEFVDTDLQNWTKELERLKSLLYSPPNLEIRELPTECISKIQLEVRGMPNIPANAWWKQNGVTVAGGNERGDTTNQLNFPEGLFVDDDQTVIIADCHNHRIVQWKSDDTNGLVIAGGNGQGNRLDQLHCPIDVLIDKETDSLIIADYSNQRVVRWSRRNGTKQGEILIDNIDCYGLALDYQRYLYVSDTENDEVRRYRLGDTNGTLVAGGNGKGNGLNQLNGPTYLFVDRQQNVYVSDFYNDRVMKWNKGAKEGIIVAGGNEDEDALTQLYRPHGIFVDTLGTLYVADTWNHRVMRWSRGDKQGTVIVGGNSSGAAANQFNCLRGLSFDCHGNLYVADMNNHRVQRFDIVN